MDSLKKFDLLVYHVGNGVMYLSHDPVITRYFVVMHQLVNSWAHPDNAVRYKKMKQFMVQERESRFRAHTDRLQLEHATRPKKVFEEFTQKQHVEQRHAIMTAVPSQRLVQLTCHEFEGPEDDPARTKVEFRVSYVNPREVDLTIYLSFESKSHPKQTVSDTVRIATRAFPTKMQNMLKAFKSRFQQRCTTSYTTLMDVVCVLLGAVPYPPERKGKQRNYITKWTTGVYKNVQDARRKHIAPTTPETERINRYIAQRFRDTTIRTPVIPREFSNTRYLYRSLHGPLEESLRRTSHLRDDGYMAFSRNLGISTHFGSLVLRLDIRAVPIGVPWIWFSTTAERRRQSSVRSHIEEEEVLLPPGTIKVIGKGSAFAKIQGTNGEFRPTRVVVHDITYEPTLDATSLSGHPIHRRVPSTTNDDPTYYTQIFG